MADEIIMIDNSPQVLEQMHLQVIRALEMCGLAAEGYAKLLCPVDTGVLRNDITHKVIDQNEEAYIGVNKQYAPYVEFGTGIYYSGGRRTSWVYQDGQGEWHMTRGQRAQPYIKPAVADHVQEYKDIMKNALTT